MQQQQQIGLTRRFTPTEAAALAGLSEKRVRKELEYKVISASSPPRLSFAALVYLRFVRGSSLQLGVEIRNRLFRRIEAAYSGKSLPGKLQISVEGPFFLSLGEEVEEFWKKTEEFLVWKESLSIDPDVMGGAVTFSNSRLTVRRVGLLVQRGVKGEEILEDYPYLTLQDLEFAFLYLQAYPKQGRPRGEYEISH